jgi:hypothetical protein
LPAFDAPPLGTCRKDIGEIVLSWASEPKPRHAALTQTLRSGRRRQPFKIPFEVGVIDFRKVAALESVSAGLDLRAKPLQSEAVLTPALLEYAKGIANRFACILVLAGFDDLLDEGILLGCQADVPGRHLGLVASG